MSYFVMRWVYDTMQAQDPLTDQMGWHMGHPLSQTLFTSIYLDKLLWPVPKTFEDTRFDRGNLAGRKSESPLVHLVLRAYCLALIKACDFVHARVIFEYYFEVGVMREGCVR